MLTQASDKELLQHKTFRSQPMQKIITRYMEVPILLFLCFGGGSCYAVTDCFYILFKLANAP